MWFIASKGYESGLDVRYYFMPCFSQSPKIKLACMMKHPILFSVCAALGLLSLSDAQAQTSDSLFDSYKLQTKQQSKLAQFPDTARPFAQKKGPARLLSPNIKQDAKNNLANRPAEVFLWKMDQAGKKERLYAPFKLKSSDTSDLNAGSIDPHIFYAPNESATPAGIVIKPLKDLDPAMVINPDEQPD